MLFTGITSREKKLRIGPLWQRLAFFVILRQPKQNADVDLSPDWQTLQLDGEL